jgi:superkiller protein 3
MSAKSYLKAARQALQDNNPEYCASLAQDALNVDPKSYFACVFMGKSFHLMGRLDDAIKAYQRAIAIEPEDLTAWKGLFLVVKSTDDYKTFFEVIADYIEVLDVQQYALADILPEIREYLQRFPYPDVQEEYKRQLLPENRLQQVTKGLLVSPARALKDYLSLVDAKEAKELSKCKMKATGGQSSGAWDIYKSSPIPHLYEELINIEDDDEKRRANEDKYLNYKLNMLKAAPIEAKSQISSEVRELVNGMIVVNHTSFQTWSLYFDWLDPEDFKDLDPEVIRNFLHKFKGKPLGQVMHALVLSDLCKLDIQLKENKPKKQEIEDELVEEETFSQEELLALMLQGLESCKNSLFAYRVVISYQDHCKMYADAIHKCQEALSLLVQATKSTGLLFRNTKRDLLVKYGNFLTHNEPPKNHKRAIEIFDKVLQDFPGNVQARVGKCIILAERGQLEESKAMLESVVADSDDDEAILELSWVQIRIGQHERGREGLTKVLKKTEGNSLYILDLKASINWKLAKSYEMTGDINKAYERLVESLRSSSNYAPSFSSLGEIYLQHFQDSKRATKCFLKAFELDLSEVKSAWYLVKDLTEKREWIRAEIYCKKIISSENAKRRLGHDSWPYRVLGCSALEVQDEAKAVEWFQNAIRVDNSDTESWVGLGEAYVGSGRLEAAVKVFKRALELDPNHWTAKYLMGVVQTQIGGFDDSIATLEDALAEKPDEECIIAALHDGLLQYAKKSVRTGFFGKAVGTALKSMDYLEKGNLKSVNYWRALSDFIQLFLQVQSKVALFPHERVLSLLKRTSINIDDGLISCYVEQKKNVQLIALLLVYANKACLSLEPAARTVRSAVFYNLGLALVISFLTTKDTQYRDEAVGVLKDAIKLQNNYQEPWIALGVASISVNPRVAQHCLIKASSIDSKNVNIWSNLALLYLRYGDSPLAVESYMRGQSLCPTEAISWLGHAFAMEQQGEHDAASGLFTHAFVLANGRNPTTQLAYGLNICMKRIGQAGDVKDLDAVLELSSACYGMIQYLKHFPIDPFGLEITCLILERLNDYELGQEVSCKLLLQLEKSFEESEDEKVLKSFTRVKAQSARFELGLNNYEAAIDACLECLDLCEDEKTVISCRTVLGLCHFFLDNFEDALEQFKQILSLSEDAKRLVVLIAQVLFVYDTEDTKQAALDQLFHNIETRGSSLLVTLVIGAISIIENLEDYLAVVKSELESLPLTELMNDRFKNVPYLISQINKRLGEDENGVWQRAALMFPDDLTVWKHLDQSIALKIAIGGKVTAGDLSECYISNGVLKDIQRGLFIAPWNSAGVEALKGCF